MERTKTDEISTGAFERHDGANNLDDVIRGADLLAGGIGVAGHGAYLPPPMTSLTARSRRLPMFSPGRGGRGGTASIRTWRSFALMNLPEVDSSKTDCCNVGQVGNEIE